MQVKVHQTVSR